MMKILQLIALWFLLISCWLAIWTDYRIIDLMEKMDKKLDEIKTCSCNKIIDIKDKRDIPERQNDEQN